MTVRKRSPTPIDVHVGGRVRLRRMQLGMSQEKLGDALDLTFQQVQKYEKGTNRIGAGRLAQIATILQVEPKFFFEGAPASNGSGGESPAPLPDPILLPSTNQGLAMATAFNALGASQRLALLHLAELMAESAAP